MQMNNCSRFKTVQSLWACNTSVSSGKLNAFTVIEWRLLWHKVIADEDRRFTDWPERYKCPGIRRPMATVQLPRIYQNYMNRKKTYFIKIRLEYRKLLGINYQ